ncbi:MAG: PcfJ domain-containing protein [SAR324 cluster bacterium]|nr:PcfJ domain-containing protein [SAR324 cluster bacterium]
MGSRIRTLKVKRGLTLTSGMMRPNPAIEYHVDEQGFLCIEVGRETVPTLRVSPWTEGLEIFIGAQRSRNETLDIEVAFFSIKTSLFGPTRPQLIKSPDSEIKKFAKAIPRELYSLASYEHAQFAMLRVLRKLGNPAFDLFYSNPNLFFLIVSDHLDKDKPLHELEKLLYLKQHHILENLYSRQFCKEHVKFIGKLGAKKKFSFANAVQIKFALRHAEILGVARHFHKFDVAQLEPLLKFPYIRQSKFARNAIKLEKDRSEFARFSELLEDVLLVGESLGYHQVEKQALNCNSVEKVEILHDRWTEKLNAKNLENEKNNAVSFPRCPFVKLPEDIQFISNSYELQLEGALMRHCVASYINGAINGQSYYFRILAPQRATLQIKKDRSGFQIAQMKLVCNRLPAKKTFKFVGNWLSQAEYGKKNSWSGIKEFLDNNH